jgi:zinc transporter, ZIP family
LKIENIIDAQPFVLLLTISLSTGIHNWGNGLIVSAIIAIGETSSSPFLVMGFVLHNVSEGITI